MKCLSLIQPWASLVILGAKRIETRSWHTNYRGPLLIHASQCKRFGKLAWGNPYTRAALQQHDIDAYTPDVSLARGGILGCVTLLDCVPADEVACNYRDFVSEGHMRQELAFGDYSPGRFAWLLSTPQQLVSHLPYKGRLGLFEVPDEVLEGASYV